MPIWWGGFYTFWFNHLLGSVTVDGRNPAPLLSMKPFEQLDILHINFWKISSNHTVWKTSLLKICQICAINYIQQKIMKNWQNPYQLCWHGAPGDAKWSKSRYHPARGLLPRVAWMAWNILSMGCGWVLEGGWGCMVSEVLFTRPGVPINQWVTDSCFVDEFVHPKKERSWRTE